MHGARAIMTAEPPSKHDLRQKPTITVDVLPNFKNTEEEKDKKENKISKNDTSTSGTASQPPPLQDELLPGQPQPPLKDTPLHGSNQSLSSAEHDTYL